MNRLPQHLETTIEAELQAIRQALRRLAAPPEATTVGDDAQPIVQAEQIFARLIGWLLDDEQQAVLSADPWWHFYLKAACLIGFGLPGTDARTAGSGPTAGSADWIETHWQALGIGDAGRAATLARICRRMSLSQEAQTLPVEPGSGPLSGSGLHEALIAAAVRLAGSLELKCPATFTAVAAHLPPDRQDDAPKLQNAFDVDGVAPHPHFPATIQVKIRCRDAELHRALKHHERAVQEELNVGNRHVRPRFLFADLIYEIEPQGYAPVDLKFSVDTAAALQLFMGNRLYADKRVFLRELIQNAVDACSVRKLSDPTFEPSISIAFNHDISRITVRDNGIGMNRQWLEKYFLSIGISFYQSDEIRSINQDPRIDIGFISQFGIGFLSSFLVAEKIVIKTRRDGSKGLRIVITSLKDYFDVRPLEEDLPAGTEVTLHLRPSQVNYCRSLEFVGYLKTNIRFLQIPVRFTDETGNTRTIGNEPLSYTGNGTGPFDYVAPVPFDDSEGYVYLKAKGHDSRIFSLESATGGVSLFQDGIFITQDETLLPEGARQNAVGRINLQGREKCELSMDRNRIFWSGNDKRQVRQKILMALAEVANRVIGDLQKQAVAEPIQASVINHLAIFFDFGEVDDRVHDRLCAPLQEKVDKRFRDFVRIHFAHTRAASGVPGADGYSEQWQQRILATFASRN